MAGLCPVQGWLAEPRGGADYLLSAEGRGHSAAPRAQALLGEGWWVSSSLRLVFSWSSTQLLQVLLEMGG